MLYTNHFTVKYEKFKLSEFCNSLQSLSVVTIFFWKLSGQDLKQDSGAEIEGKRQLYWSKPENLMTNKINRVPLVMVKGTKSL